MNLLKSHTSFALTLVAGMLACGIATATPITMNFDGMTNAKDGEWAGNYYNGGCGTSYVYNSKPTDCNGPNYGVVWSGSLIGGAPDGLYINVANQPSGSNVMALRNIVSPVAYMNVANGLQSLSFSYASAGAGGSFTVYSGLNGTGTSLGTWSLNFTGDKCDGYSQDFSCWKNVGVRFSGAAHSVAFSSEKNQTMFDDVSFEPATPAVSVPVPEPWGFGIFGLGLLLIGALGGLRHRTN